MTNKQSKETKKYTITKRNGKVDIVLDDGVYNLKAKVTIKVEGGSGVSNI